MVKEFLSYETVRNNALKLAGRIYREGFVPDVIYVLLRGGAYLGNVIGEFFKAVRRGTHPVFYAAVVARSYTGVRESEAVRVDGWTYDPRYLRGGDRVLVVDDIFDSGRTINHLVDLIVAQGVPADDVRVAVHDYKVRSFQTESPRVAPTYYCRKIMVDRPEDDIWVHYLSHELIGLEDAEIAEHYTSGDPELESVFDLMRNP